MKRFIVTAAVLLPLFFFAACNSSKNPEANVSSASPAASAATITASPNPVPAGEGVGTTTITWNTGDGTVGQVYVSVDGGLHPKQDAFARYVVKEDRGEFVRSPGSL
ncbi:MAG: hypothetical protein AUH86_01240 [Acidobacteria bacterium 13_1_40CM_4_58_4]|nr:MAG: hypothetical protein AUH86_01240 [Acidobacteria bacterium 13_1_40CM_4_58_4]